MVELVDQRGYSYTLRTSAMHSVWGALVEYLIRGRVNPFESDHFGDFSHSVGHNDSFVARVDRLVGCGARLPVDI